MTSAALPLLLTVTVCAADALLSVWLKASVVGDAPITGFSATPVPARLVLLWPPLALCVITRLALRAPAAAGVSARVTVQLPAPATEPPAAQVPPVMLNSVLAVVIVPTISAALPVFDRVTVCAVLAVPTLTLPNASDGVSDAIGAAAAVAVPLRLTVPGLPAALCVMVNDPLRAPITPAAGRNATDTVQLAPAATLPPAAHVPPATV